MPCTINNNTSHDLSQLEDLTKKLVPFAQKQIGFNRPPTINFNDDEKNAANPLGRTGQYDPSSLEITIFVTGRHVKDVLRSIAHELVHHGQNLRGEFDKPISTEMGYAQNNEHLRGMEREAYEIGNLCFRDWEDGIKQQLPLHETIYRESLIGGENMSTKDWRIHELNDLLMEKWGYKRLSEGTEGAEEDEEALEEGIPTTIVNDYETGQKAFGELDEDDDEEESSSEIHEIPQESLKESKKKILINVNLKECHNLSENKKKKAKAAKSGWDWLFGKGKYITEPGAATLDIAQKGGRDAAWLRRLARLKKLRASGGKYTKKSLDDIVKLEVQEALGALDTAEKLPKELKSVKFLADNLIDPKSGLPRIKNPRFFYQYISDSLEHLCTLNPASCISVGIMSIAGLSLWGYLSAKEQKDLIDQGVHPSQEAARAYEKKKEEASDIKQQELDKKIEDRKRKGKPYKHLLDPRYRDALDL